MNAESKTKNKFIFPIRTTITRVSLFAAYWSILWSLANSLVTIATTDPHAYAGVLTKSITYAGIAAALLLIIILLDKNIVVRLIAAGGFLPILFVIHEFIQRAPYVFD